VPYHIVATAQCFWQHRQRHHVEGTSPDSSPHYAIQPAKSPWKVLKFFALGGTPNQATTMQPDLVMFYDELTDFSLEIPVSFCRFAKPFGGLFQKGY